MSRTNNPNLNNINADTQVEVNVRYTEFNNINNGGVIFVRKWRGKINSG